MNWNQIARRILDAAVATGGDTWGKIEQAAPIYVKGYAKSLAEIAAGVAAGGISPEDGAMYAQTARLLLVQGIANSAHVLYSEVQEFIDSVMDIVAAAISGAVGFPI